jgi:hypothetical protein
VLLDASVAGKLDKVTVDGETLTGMLTYEVVRICSTPSVLSAPEIRAGVNKGVGMAIAQSVGVQSVALALQAQLGYQPEQIKVTLLGEDGATEALVSGSGLGGRIRTPPFQEHIVMQKGESLTSLVHRAALAGMTKIDPYVTALYLLQAHTDDGDFNEAETLVNATKTQLPPTPASFDRALLENLQGMMALFRGQLDDARSWFHRASDSDPNNVAATLNDSFVDVQLGHYHEAAAKVEALLTKHAPDNQTLLATAYVTWGAALLGLHDFDAAEQKATQAATIDPFDAASYELWSDVEREKGDEAAADRLNVKAWGAAGTYRTYTEIAALYFRVAVEQGQKLARSRFNNPTTIRFN